MFAVVGSSGFHTLYSQFSHAFGDRVVGSSVTEMSCVSQDCHCSDMLELRSQVRSIAVGNEPGHRNLRFVNDCKFTTQVLFT